MTSVEINTRRTHRRGAAITLHRTVVLPPATRPGSVRDLSKRSDDEREALSLLVALDAPMEESLQLALLGGTAASTITLGDLERDGLAIRDDQRRWSIAHPLTAHDVRAQLTPALKQRSAQRLGVALLTAARELSALRRAVRLLLEGNDTPTALDGVVRWYSSQGATAPAVDELVATLRVAQPNVEFEHELYRRLWWRQAWWRHPAVVALVSVILAVAIIAR